MENINLAVINSLTGTIVIVFIYVYLYGLYRERYMGLWASAWILMLSRYIIFDAGLWAWKDYSISIIAYQWIIFVATLSFVIGTYQFINRPLNKRFIYILLGIVAINSLVTIGSLPLLFKVMIPICLCCFMGIWIGWTFIRYSNKFGFGRLVTGYTFIAWSLLSFALPFSVVNYWFGEWGYVAGGILRLTIAIGTLMAYFEKNRAELSIKEKEYRLLAENAVDIIYSLQLGSTSVLKYISPAALAITGYSPEEYYKKPRLLFDLVHPEDQELLQEFLRDFPASVDTLLTLRLFNKHKQIVWVEQKCVPLYGEQGNLIELQGIVRDITMRKRLEDMETMCDRMNMVGNMAATVAHEIRNPLTTVQGYLQVFTKKTIYKEDRATRYQTSS